MSERRVPAPHHVYSEETDLESFSWSKLMNLIAAEVIYVEDVTRIPQQGQIVEFHVLGASVQAIITYSSLTSRGDRAALHIQATRLQN